MEKSTPGSLIIAKPWLCFLIFRRTLIGVWGHKQQPVHSFWYTIYTVFTTIACCIFLQRAVNMMLHYFTLTILLKWWVNGNDQNYPGSFMAEWGFQPKYLWSKIPSTGFPKYVTGSYMTPFCLPLKHYLAANLWQLVLLWMCLMPTQPPSSAQSFALDQCLFRLCLEVITVSAQWTWSTQWPVIMLAWHFIPFLLCHTPHQLWSSIVISTTHN